MRFLTIDEKGGQPGIIVGNDKVLNLAKVPKSLVPGWRPSSIKEIFERGKEGLNAVRRIADTVESAMEACQPALSELMETELCPPRTRSVVGLLCRNELWQTSCRNEQLATPKKPFRIYQNTRFPSRIGKENFCTTPMPRKN